MRFHVLGPLAVDRDGDRVELGGPKQRLALALLLSNAGRVVSDMRLVDGIWGESPPEAARNSLQSYISNLRSALGGAGTIVRRDGGYALEATEDQVDALEFERLILRARADVAERPLEAAAALRRALEMWEGDPYEDLVDEPALQLEIHRLREARLTAVEQWIDAELAVGDHGAIIPDLERLTREHPTRERFWGQLMEALYRTGRQAEALRAYERARTRLAEELGLEPGPDLRALEDRILRQDPSLLGATVPAGSPYKGLRSFDEADARHFFGRHALVGHLVDRLGRRGPGGHLVVLTGPSGGGKTSVVRAGLIPALRGGSLPGSADWRHVSTYPGSAPYRMLAEALGLPGLDDPDEPIGRLADAEHDTLLFVDQFEELWTLVTDARLRRRYLDDLVDLTERSRHVRVVLAIRADFLDRLVADPAMSPILESVLVVAPPLTDAELTEAIVGPARQAGVAVEPDLVARIVHDAHGRAGVLPLLQYTLAELFDRRGHAALTLEAYEAMGGIAGALSARADERFRHLSPPLQQTAQRVFLRLVAVTESGDVTKRPATRSELDRLADGPEIDRVLDEFGGHRFLVFDRGPEGRPSVDIAHESLLREWPRLRGWVEERREDLRRRARLGRAALEWEESGRDESYLLAGRRLAELETWRDSTDLPLTTAESSFLDAGVRARDARIRRSTRLRRALISVLGLAVVVTGTLAAVALRQRTDARHARDEANAERLASAAVAQIAENPQLALLLAIEAFDAFSELGDDAPGTVLDALHDAVGANRAVAGLDAGSFVAYSPDGSRIAALIGDVAGYAAGQEATIGIFDAETTELLMSLSPGGSTLTDLTYGGDPGMVAATTLEGRVTVWDEQGAVVAEWDVAGATDNPTFGPDHGFSVNVADISEGVWLHTIVYDSSDWSERFRIPIDTAQAVGFDPTGGFLATSLADPGLVGIVDAHTGTTVAELPHDAVPIAAAFDPVDGARIATLTVAPIPTLSVWDVGTREILAETEVPSVSLSVAWRPDGHVIATAGEDGIVRTWDPETLRPVGTLHGHRGGLNAVRSSISYHPSGTRLASAGADGHTIVWNVEPGPAPEVATITNGAGPVEAASFAGPTTIAAATPGALIRVDTRRTGQPRLVEVDAGDGGLLLSRDGLLVALFGGDGPTTILDASTLEVSTILDGPLRPIAMDSAIGMVVTDSRIPAEPPIVHDLASGAPVMELPIGGEDQSIDLADFDPGGRFLATAYAVGVVAIWDLDTGRAIGTLPHDGFVTALAFGPDGTRLTTGDLSGSVLVWDVAAIAGGEPEDAWLLRRIAHPLGAPLAVHLTPGGEVAALGHDGRVTFWDPSTGGELYDVETGTAGGSFDFDEAGARMVVPGPEGRISIYAIDPDLLAEIARSRVIRGFSAEECARYAVDPCRPLEDIARHA